MSIKLLMSACLVGQCCRWDGLNGKSIVNRRLHCMLSSGEVAVICPECAAGLPVPREPAEIEPGGSASAVLAGKSHVYTRSGADVSEAYIRGAHAALELVEKHQIRIALLKSRSPSCGRHCVHNGHFDGGLVAGAGVTAQLLLDHGIAVFDEDSLEEALKHC